MEHALLRGRVLRAHKRPPSMQRFLSVMEPGPPLQPSATLPVCVPVPVQQCEERWSLDTFSELEEPQVLMGVSVYRDEGKWKIGITEKEREREREK